MQDRKTADLLPHHLLLLDWWSMNRRSFPWRGDGVSAYQMVVTEMLLWKTRAEMVDGVWRHFFTSFPDVHTLAKAEEDEVQAIIAPLGLRKRSALLVDMARALQTRFDGIVPADRAELMSLDGVGEYVSSAVLSFHFKMDAAVFDANIRRVMFRLLGTDDEATAKRHAESLLPPGWSAEWNYALLDLGAIVCRWKPSCVGCPLASICVTPHRKKEKHA
jgi:A/G-specific adenine glycosylase